MGEDEDVVAPRRRDGGVSRREVLVAGAALGAGIALGGAATVSAAGGRRVDFSALPDATGWPGFAAPGVANVRVEGGRGVLEAGSDVFPNDPRPVAFAVDHRFADGEVTATIERFGAAAGVVARRVGHRTYYAVIHAPGSGELTIVRRTPDGIDVLGRTGGLPAIGGEGGGTAPGGSGGGSGGAATLTLSVAGRRPTRLTARLERAGRPPLVVEAADSAHELQRAGDAGVLATAQTLFPSAGPAALPALGNVHLLPYGVQEGQAFLDTGVGRALMDRIREASTLVLRAFEIRTAERPKVTAPTAIAATTGAPLARGAILRVATDVPARVAIEVSTDPRFRRSRTLRPTGTDPYNAVLRAVRGLPTGRTVHWRVRLTRRGVRTVGPARSFRVLPGAGDPRPVRLAIGACAAQFGPLFDEIAARRPDVFVWQGDLNYPDTVGPLAQTLTGYAGIWRELLAGPRLEPIVSRAAFAVQRDDHDYGVQDANSTILVPHGLEPWESLMEARTYYRFRAGAAEVWVLDQRRFKTDPEQPDGDGKTLLGAAQRAWLLRTLAASRAPFKVICSPCTLAPLDANARDGSWAAGFAHERDLLLKHVADRVSGTTLFVTGDTHWTMAYERDGLFEVRPCPLGIPTPNDITLTQPNVAEDARKQPGVLYADDDRSHVAQLDVRGRGGDARLELQLVREDGAVPFRRTFAP